MIYIGIDPGWSGGIAMLEEGYAPRAWKMPGSEKAVQTLFQDIDLLMSGGLCKCCLEDVHSMPIQGCKQAFAFGANVGCVKTCLAVIEVPYTLVAPSKWMRHLGCLTGGDKSVSKKFAQNIFPAIKVTEAIGEALLIAKYCQEIYA